MTNKTNTGSDAVDLNKLAQDAGFVLNPVDQLVVPAPNCDARPHLVKFAALIAQAHAAAPALHDIESAARAIYQRFPGAEAHPWVPRGNSDKQDEARRYARAALATQQAGVEAVPVADIRWSPSAGYWLLSVRHEFPKVASAVYELYAAPVAQHAAPLTDARIDELWSESGWELGDGKMMRFVFARAIERELSAGSAASAVDARDAGALELACAINKKLGDALLGRSYLLPDDLAALKRFEECAADFDSGGHDVSKAAMARLREIGVVQSIGFGRHQTTSFGDYVLERNAGEPVNLPLMTLVERNAAMAAQPTEQAATTQEEAKNE